MQNEGIVTHLDGAYATVRIRKSSACGHDCGECRVCNNPEIEINVANAIGAQEGDTVIIGADTSSVLWNAFLLYVLPVMGLFAIYMTLYSLSVPTYTTIISVVLWIALWFVFMRKKSKNVNIKSCILEVVHEKN